MDNFLYSLDFNPVIKNISQKEKKALLKFGKHIRELRLSMGLTQEELNFRSDLSKNAVGLIERGEINCSLLTMEALAKGLGIPKKKLLDYE